MERKLATVLFADIVGSTELVASTDPEVARRRVSRFFEAISRCIEAHGGTIEKFAGDAVLTVFGAPLAHEDHAERAARTAVAILDAVGELGLEVRLGLESGEVVVDDAESTFATGEPVHLAARLQQGAGPGEVLVGPTAHRLLAGRIVAEPLGPRSLRGFDRDTQVWRLVGVEGAAAARRRDAAPFVGRESELELLENIWERTVRSRRAHLFTVYGEPGVGKSRLVREFLSGLEGATVLVGRCLPYGEAITYWPLAEMVKAAAGITDDEPAERAMEKLRRCCGEEAVADLLALATGVLESVTRKHSGQEIAWAASEWAAELAGVQPLVLAFEDVHWADERLLELVERLADQVRAPLLVVCLARPDLLEHRHSWGGGHLRASAIELEPLVEAESETLVDALLRGLVLAPQRRRELLAKAEGNPLFLEETVRMVEEQGDLERVPDTIQALIAARIDRLPAAEKEAVRRAAVIGRVFWASAVGAIGADTIDGGVLDALIERDLAIPQQRSTISGERAFRFKHGLIRDAAYAELSKGDRATLHRAFAGWLQSRGVDELVEIRAHHLDVAARLVEELDGRVPPDLASETAAALHAAGMRALSREANRQSRALLLRSVELEPTLERRFDAARAAWRLTDLPAVSEEMERVRTLAVSQGDARTEARSLVALAEVALLRDADLPRGAELVERALALLGGEASEDRYDALMIRGRISWWLGDVDEMERIAAEACEIAEALGRADLIAAALMEAGNIALMRLDLGGAETLVTKALELAEASGSPVVQGWKHFTLARIEHLSGHREEARAHAERALELFAQTGDTWGHARTLNRLARIADDDGDLERAELLLRDAIGLLERVQDRGSLCESQRSLAQVVLRSGRIDEAERLALAARATVGPHDATSRATTRMALALVRGAQSADAEAEELFREALEILDPTGLKLVRLEVLDACSAFLHERGRAGEAARYDAELELLRAPLLAA